MKANKVIFITSKVMYIKMQAMEITLRVEI